MARVALNVLLSGDCVLECLKCPVKGGSEATAETAAEPLFCVVFNAAFIRGASRVTFRRGEIDFSSHSADAVIPSFHIAEAPRVDAAFGPDPGSGPAETPEAALSVTRTNRMPPSRCRIGGRIFGSTCSSPPRAKAKALRSPRPWLLEAPRRTSLETFGKAATTNDERK